MQVFYFSLNSFSSCDVTLSKKPTSFLFLSLCHASIWKAEIQFWFTGIALEGRSKPTQVSSSCAKFIFDASLNSCLLPIAVLTSLHFCGDEEPESPKWRKPLSLINLPVTKNKTLNVVDTVRCYRLLNRQASRQTASLSPHGRTGSASGPDWAPVVSRLRVAWIPDRTMTRSGSQTIGGMSPA